MVPSPKPPTSRPPQVRSKREAVPSQSNPEAVAAPVATTSKEARAADGVTQVPVAGGGGFRWFMLAGIVVFLVPALVFGGCIFWRAGLGHISSTISEAHPGGIVGEAAASVEGPIEEMAGETRPTPSANTPTQPEVEPAPFEFRGLPLGSAFADVQAAYTLQRGSAIKNDEPEVNEAEAHFYATGVAYAGEEDCTVNFKFWKGRLYEIYVFLPHQARTDLVAAFTAKYGEPSRSGLSSLANEEATGEAEIAKALQDVLSLIADADQSVTDTTQWANERYRISIYANLLGGKQVVLLDMHVDADVSRARAEAAAEQL